MWSSERGDLQPPLWRSAGGRELATGGRQGHREVLRELQGAGQPVVERGPYQAQLPPPQTFSSHEESRSRANGDVALVEMSLINLWFCSAF